MTEDQRLILRELDGIHQSITNMHDTLKSHNGRLRKMEAIQERLQGAKDALGWRVPLIIGVSSGVAAKLLTEWLGRGGL